VNDFFPFQQDVDNAPPFNPPRARQSTLDRRLAFVKEEHAWMLKALREEIEKLRMRNRGKESGKSLPSFTHFRLVQIFSVSSSSFSKARSTTTIPPRHYLMKNSNRLN